MQPCVVEPPDTPTRPTENMMHPAAVQPMYASGFERRRPCGRTYADFRCPVIPSAASGTGGRHQPVRRRRSSRKQGCGPPGRLADRAAPDADRRIAGRGHDRGDGGGAPVRSRRCRSAGNRNRTTGPGATPRMPTELGSRERVGPSASVAVFPAATPTATSARRSCSSVPPVPDEYVTTVVDGGPWAEVKGRAALAHPGEVAHERSLPRILAPPARSHPPHDHSDRVLHPAHAGPRPGRPAPAPRPTRPHGSFSPAPSAPLIGET